MKSFKEYINEAIEFVQKGTKPVSVFIGRMQPIHKGHQSIINQMKNPVVLLVKGKQSSQDKKRNPFDEKYQEKLIKKLNKNVEVRVVPTGYLPEIANELRKEGKELTDLYAGSDRLPGYKSQFERLNLNDELKFEITYHETPRIASATDVRNAIINNDEKKFKQIMPQELWSEFSIMQKKLKKAFA